MEDAQRIHAMENLLYDKDHVMNLDPTIEQLINQENESVDKKLEELKIPTYRINILLRRPLIVGTLSLTLTNLKEEISKHKE